MLVVGCVAVVTGRLWRAFVFWGRRLLFSCSRRHYGSCSGQCPSPFCRLKHSVQAMLSSFLAFAEFGTGEGLLRYGICAPCKKQASSGTRRIFGSIRCKKQASTVRNGYSVPEAPFSGTGHVCQHPKISGNRYCNRMGRRNVGFDEENQRSFGLLPSNFVSLQNGIEVWCNGSTTDFGSACPSSNLGTSTFLREVRHY